MKKKLLLSLAFCTLGAVAVQAQTAATDIADKKQTLYSTSADGSAPYRIPAIAVMNNNEIIAIADYRPDGNDIGSNWLGSVYDVDIYAKFGTIDATGNYTWTPETNSPAKAGAGVVVANGSDDTGHGDAAIAVDRNAGSGMVLIMSAGGQVAYSSATTSKDYRCYKHVSTDYGRTWTTTNMTSTFRGNDNILTGSNDVKSMFFASGRLLQSSYKKTGSNYYRIYGALLVRIGSTNYNYVVYTDDFGTNWKLLGGEGTGACCSSANEAKLEELPNGQIILSSRKTSGRYFNVFTYADGGFDEGNGSWNSQTATCTFNNEVGSSGGDTNGELLLYKGVYKVGETTGEQYDILLQSLPTGSSRSNVSVYYKAISGETFEPSDFTSGWTKGIEVDNGASAYSTMTILPNGQIGFLYEDDYSTSKYSGGGSEIIYVPLTVEEITGGAYTTTAPVVSVAPTISLSAAATTLNIGGTTQLTLTTNSDGAVSYTSSNTAVATVSASGVVTAVAAGEVTITANVAATEQYNAASATVTITVNAPVVVPVAPTISLSAAATTLTVGETTALTLTTNSDGAVSYTSSNTAVATVSASGVVTAVAAGEVTITANVAATEQYNAASATVTITVEAKAEEVTTYDVTAVGGEIGTVSYYIATFSAPVATIVPSGVKAYYVKVGGSDVVTLTRISSGKVIPAGQGVILISSTQEFTMTSTTDESNVADLTGNLMGASLDGVIPAGSYVLAVKGSGDLKDQFAFCLTSSELKLSGNRAYLQLSGNNAPQMRMRIEEESTDMEASEPTSDEAPVIYDLTGRRVTEMLPGRIYIVNGKKFVR